MSEMLVVWRVSAMGPCECGTYAYPLYFPLYRIGADAWTPLDIRRCIEHMPTGAWVIQ